MHFVLPIIAALNFCDILYLYVLLPLFDSDNGSSLGSCEYDG